MRIQYTLTFVTDALPLIMSKYHAKLAGHLLQEFGVLRGIQFL